MTASLAISSEASNVGTASELIVLWIRGLLERRITWLDADQDDWPDAEAAWLAGHDSDSQSDVKHRLFGSEGAVWPRLVDLFQLSSTEANLLAVAVAVAAEPALGPLVARAQRAEGRFLPTEPLVKRLFGTGPNPIWRPASSLSIWGLLTPTRYTPGEPVGFEADPQIVDWLFGILSLDSELMLAVESVEADLILPEWPVATTADRFGSALEAGSEVRLVIDASSQAECIKFAAAVATALGSKPLAVDPVPLREVAWPDRFMRVQRFALAADSALIWRDGGPRWPNKIPLAPVQMVCVSEGQAPPERESCADLAIKLPELSVASKTAIWQRLMPHCSTDAAQLAATPGVSLADMDEVCRLVPQTKQEAMDHLRAKARTRMQGAGRVVDPRFAWGDLVVSPPLLQELQTIVFEARTRPSLLEDPEIERLFAGTAGLSALFSGPPGVGKSMAAQVIARDLGVNLLVVDLASTTSKYVGETAKNLTVTFARAAASGAALIFEEADAFFAKRTDVRDSNDRHANSDTNHLLQLLEGHTGLVILSTNQRANIDPAFIRRLRHVVDFPRPGLSERRTLWSVMLAALKVDEGALSEGLDRLAASHDLSPAQIKSATLSARYSALAANRDVCLQDLQDGATRELTKEGRSVSTPKARKHRIRSHG